jgi:hypothetical protein
MTLRTHCKNGHALTGDNLIVRSTHGRDFRACRTCKRAKQADYLRRNPEKRQRPPDIGDQRRAVNLVGKQIARGTIVKGPCRDCGTTANVQESCMPPSKTGYGAPREDERLRAMREIADDLGRAATEGRAALDSEPSRPDGGERYAAGPQRRSR